MPENKPPSGADQPQCRECIHSEYILRQRAIMRPLSVVEIPNSIVDSPMPKIPKSTMGRRPITSSVYREYYERIVVNETHLIAVPTGILI